MARYACVKTFSDAAIVTTPFSQTISSVVDGRTGTAFAGHTFIFLCNLALVNAFYPGSNPADIGGQQWNIGVARADTMGGSSGTGNISAFGGFKFTGGGVGSRYAVITALASGFGGGQILSVGYVANITAGTFDVTWNGRVDFGFLPARMVLILGGTGWDIDIDAATMDGVHATTGAPQGVLSIAGSNTYSASFSSATGAGGGTLGIGWATRDGDYGCAVEQVLNQAGNVRAQLTDRLPVVILDGPPRITSGMPLVTDWGTTSYTIAGEAGDSIGATNLAFSGADVIAAAGTITTPAVDGVDTVDLGLDPDFVIFASIGRSVSSSVDNTQASISVGWTDRSGVTSLWSGENEIGNNPPQLGANYLSTAYAIQTATPAGLATILKNKMAVAPITATDGILDVTFTDTDGSTPQTIWFAIGTAIPVPPPPPSPVFRTREVVRRRLRRAPIVWNEKGGLQTRVRINLFAVDMQPGVGTSDTPDPLVMIRASKDGGFTWGNERRLTAGRVGEFFNRINAWQWGQGRDWVFEVSCTDPVLWNLVGAYFDAEGGEN